MDYLHVHQKNKKLKFPGMRFNVPTETNILPRINTPKIDFSHTTLSDAFVKARKAVNLFGCHF